MGHKKLCEDCGTILEINEYSQLWCPRCHDKRVKDMHDETDGGYY